MIIITILQYTSDCPLLPSMETKQHPVSYSPFKYKSVYCNIDHLYMIYLYEVPVLYCGCVCYVVCGGVVILTMSWMMYDR